MGFKELGATSTHFPISVLTLLSSLQTVFKEPCRSLSCLLTLFLCVYRARFILHVHRKNFRALPYSSELSPTWHLCWPGPRCSPIPQSANLNSPPPGAIGWISSPTFVSTGVAHGQPQPRHPASPHTQCTETHTQASQLTSKWFCKINIWRCCCCC